MTEHHLNRLEHLLPLMSARTFQVTESLHIMNGSDCFSGSMKGISAFGAVKRALQGCGDAIMNKTLLDASSGNFARALALIAEYLELPCEVIVSTKATTATLELIKVHGAKVTIGGDTTRECYETAQAMASEEPEKYLLVGQLDNWGNPEAHELITGPLIQPGFSEIYLAMGSGGGVSGITKHLRKGQNPPNIFVTVAKPGNKIVGTFSNDSDYETPFIRELRENDWLAGELPISTSEAIHGMEQLRKEYGLLCGLSAGGVYAAYKMRVPDPNNSKALLLAWDSHDRWIEKLS